MSPLFPLLIYSSLAFFIPFYQGKVHSSASLADISKILKASNFGDRIVTLTCLTANMHALPLVWGCPSGKNMENKGIPSKCTKGYAFWLCFISNERKKLMYFHHHDILHLIFKLKIQLCYLCMSLILIIHYFVLCKWQWLLLKHRSMVIIWRKAYINNLKST